MSKSLSNCGRCGSKAEWINYGKMVVRIRCSNHKCASSTNWVHPRFLLAVRAFWNKRKGDFEPENEYRNYLRVNWPEIDRAIEEVKRRGIQL